MQIAYPIECSRHDSAVRACIPDIPEVAAEAATRELAVADARRRLVDALTGYVRARRDIPAPARDRWPELVEPPLLIAAKIALYQTMRDQDVSNVALARRLGAVEGTVRRLVDLRHRSHIDQIEAALAVLGKRLVLEMRVA